MNFQDLKKIEEPQFYLDVAFKRASAKIKEKKLRETDWLKKTKMLETSRLDMVKDNLKEPLDKIIKNFPNLETLDKFYQELIKCTLDYASLKKSLGSIAWASDKIGLFTRQYQDKIKKANDVPRIKALRKEYYGRISSIMKQIKRFLYYLEESRKVMKRYPAVKTSVFTVCIFGFPNVGKSTLLSRLTSADPEVNAYPFTTKHLNFGYIENALKKIQIVDTPGTLNRFGKMNEIELQAYLAVRHLANLIVYVFDPTLEYSMKEQISLLQNVEKYGKKTLIYLSKIDLVDEEATKEFTKRYPSIISDYKILKEKIMGFSKEFN